MLGEFGRGAGHCGVGRNTVHPVIGISSAHALRRAVRSAQRPGRLRELQAGQPPNGLGRPGRGRPLHPGLRHRHQRQPRRDRPLQDDTPTDDLALRHLPPRLLRRRRRPPRSRTVSRRGVPLPQEPAGLPHRRRHRPRRLRQLGRVGVLGGARRRGLRRLHRPARRAPTPAAQSHIVFVVRNDASHSDMLFQTSDTTWQAYNTYGGNSLYAGPDAAGPGLQGQLQPAVHHACRHDSRGLLLQRRVPDGRFLERNGYDVSYITGVDTDRRGALLLEPQGRSCRSATTSTGRARSAPTSRRRATPASTSRSSAATRSSGRPAGSRASTAPSTPYRTLVSYKETAGQREDRPDPPTWTGTWRDPRFSPPADGGRPGERADRHDLHGQLLARPRSRCPPPTARCGSGATPRVATLAAGHDALAHRRHPRLRVGRGPRQRLPPGRADPRCRPRRSTGAVSAPGLRHDLRRRAPPPTT